MFTQLTQLQYQGNPANEHIWAVSAEADTGYRKAIETRYQLLPYLYTLFQEAATTGAPIMRPLYYHYPQDETAVGVEDAFLIGDTLLSAPITEPGLTQRDVYLPEGIWLDYWDGTEYTGNSTSPIPAPLDRWPLLVRGNSILPSIPIMQYVDQQPNAPVTFTCYMTTDGLASYILYEDDGNSQSYRNGAFAKTSVSCRVDNDTITVRIDEQHQGYRPAHEEYEVIVKVGNRTLQQKVQSGQGTAIVHL